MQLTIQTRRIYEVNTDPQRRCYYGVHAKSELVWGKWEDFADATEQNVKEKLQFWRELNADAVRARGNSAKREFRIKEYTEV